MTIMEYYRVTATDAEGIESREPVRYVFEKTGKGVDLEHNHDLLTLDDFKRSKRMLEMAAKFVAQGFSAADVFNALRADDKPQIHQLFLNAGGGPLTRKNPHCWEASRAKQPGSWARGLKSKNERDSRSSDFSPNSVRPLATSSRNNEH